MYIEIHMFVYTHAHKKQYISYSSSHVNEYRPKSYMLLATCSFVAQLVKNLPAMQETRVGKIPWRRKWQPTPVFLPGESHGQRNLAGYSPWGHKSRTCLSN